MAEAQAEWERTMSERVSALQAEKESELAAAEQEHSKQLATLGRKLADTETELAGIREREALNQERIEELETSLADTESALAQTKEVLSETQSTRDRLQTELSETREARDGLQQELEASRSRIEMLEGNKKELESRVGSLDALKSQLESKLSMAVEKIAKDDALLERVRKAMAIGLGLLEEQEKNTYGEAIHQSGAASDDAE
jgi:chromosome segregation ATPase